ncbi:glycosyltransferase family 4 protein [Blastopirellula marina]|uniref:Glycosyl transferase, group 1 family protein LpsE n=1 Tax=Blastopirellula marina DSM 3645 TaxID=314230 RepID=A4A135_9BACT|nr:glycosyltransferase family 4 protein [Blastopirellula marina]EAQ77495.1 glycosyl transferase, group 1 family protein LpsE [Blastopirellula marina DSM 3645]
MKVLIVNNMVPFVWGGAEELGVHLHENLIKAGHEAEILRIPFQWEPQHRILSQMLLVRALELDNVDKVIAFKFPAYLIRHPRKTLWLLHQYRQAYDLYDAGQTNLVGEDGKRIQHVIKEADREAFSESHAIYINSDVTQQRLAHYNGFDSQVLRPPVNGPEMFLGGKCGEYVFAGGRVNDMKRQFLLIQAMAKTNANVRLIIGGPPDYPKDGERLHRLVSELGLADRVKLDLRFLPREEYANYIRNARAVAYLPFDEDSLGYVAMEAATAGKALLTTTDSGGILGLVKHMETGWVASPDPESLAVSMNAAFESEQRAIDYGHNAQRLWDSFGVNWENTIQVLLR